MSERHDEPKWCLDSGATSHLCKELQDFSEIHGTGSGKLNLANNESTEIKARGTVVFSTNNAGKQSKIRLNDTLHVPDLRTNLLSVGKITENNYDVIFRKNTAYVVDYDGKIKMEAKKINGLYFVRENQDHECRATSESSRTFKFHGPSKRATQWNFERNEFWSSRRQTRVRRLCPGKADENDVS